jgi:hypothetical protein
MKPNHHCHTLLILLLCLSGSAQAAANLLSNGGFEINAGTTRTGFAGVSDYTPILQGGEIASTWGVYSPEGYYAALIDGTDVNNPEGDYFVSLHSDSPSSTFSEGYGIITSFDSSNSLYGLTSPLVPGTTYTLCFDVANYGSRLRNQEGFPENLGDFIPTSDDGPRGAVWAIDILDSDLNTLDRLAGPMPSNGVTPVWSSPGWIGISYNFTYDESMVYLGISSAHGIGSAILVDNACLTPATIIPEPSASLLGLLGGLLASFRRRR